MILDYGDLALLKPRIRVPKIPEFWLLSIADFQTWVAALTGPCSEPQLLPHPHHRGRGSEL